MRQLDAAHSAEHALALAARCVRAGVGFSPTERVVVVVVVVVVLFLFFYSYFIFVSFHFIQARRGPVPCGVARNGAADIRGGRSCPRPRGAIGAGRPGKFVWEIGGSTVK